MVIYLDVPEHIRKERMSARNDNQSMIDERIRYDEIAFKDITKYSDNFIYNLDSEKTAEEIAEYLGLSKNNQYQLVTEREIIDKLCQIQMLIRSIHPNVHYIEINMENCFDNPLEYDNNYIISGKNNNNDPTWDYTIWTSDNESGNAKYLKIIVIRLISGN